MTHTAAEKTHHRLFAITKALSNTHPEYDCSCAHGYRWRKSKGFHFTFHHAPFFRAFAPLREKLFIRAPIHPPIANLVIPKQKIGLRKDAKAQSFLDSHSSSLVT
jgi:hypothetical protein